VTYKYPGVPPLNGQVGIEEDCAGFEPVAKF